MFPGEDFAVEPVSMSEGIPSQPATDAETLEGAKLRTERAASLVPNADFWVGIEGGIDDVGAETAAFAWVVVKSGNRVGTSRSGTFLLPEAVARIVKSGEELGRACDLMFQENNTKQHGGAVGLLTRNVIDRTALYEHAVILALVRFLATTGSGADECKSNS
jgi:inosine/xanthosine triphosphatase